MIARSAKRAKASLEDEYAADYARRDDEGNIIEEDGAAPNQTCSEMEGGGGGAGGGGKKKRSSAADELCLTHVKWGEGVNKGTWFCNYCPFSQKSTMCRIK